MPGLHSEFKHSQNYKVKPWLKKNKEKMTLLMQLQWSSSALLGHCGPFITWLVYFLIDVLLLKDVINSRRRTSANLFALIRRDGCAYLTECLRYNREVLHHYLAPHSELFTGLKKNLSLESSLYDFGPMNWENVIFPCSGVLSAIKKLESWRGSFCFVFCPCETGSRSAVRAGLELIL